MKIFILILLMTLSCGAADYSKLIEKYSSKYGVDEKMIRAIIAVESSGNNYAKHKDGSYGLMQIQYGTAQVMGYRGSREGLFDPETNISIGVKYYRYLLDMFKNDNIALDAYNRGWGNVKKYPYRSDWSKHKYVGLIQIQLIGRRGK